MSLFDKIKAMSKAIVGVVGFIVGVLNEALPILPDPYKGYVTGFIGLVTLLGIYHAPYAPLGAKRAAAGKPAAGKLHP